MIARYTRPEMGRIFSDENRFLQWLEVELAASEALAETGEVPREAAQALRKFAGFEVARIHEIEREVKHDVIAFLTHLEEERKNGVSTRNVRLSAIHALFHFVASRNPEHLELAQRVLGIPFKRSRQRAIDYLE